MLERRPDQETDDPMPNALLHPARQGSLSREKQASTFAARRRSSGRRQAGLDNLREVSAEESRSRSHFLASQPTRRYPALDRRRSSVSFLKIALGCGWRARLPIRIAEKNPTMPLPVPPTAPSSMRKCALVIVHPAFR